MRAVAESIKRLYEAGKLTGEQLAQRVEKGTLTLEEYNEIVGEGEQA
ncbi:MAG: XkdX family protein [Phascolarctobacterium sp.]|nr:MAG: XkdX family protein [Phascolarctobacterium sp.]